MADLRIHHIKVASISVIKQYNIFEKADSISIRKAPNLTEINSVVEINK